MIPRLFMKRRSSEDFKYDLAKATKAGKVDDIINTIRSQLEITGIKSSIPSPRHFLRATAEIVTHITNFSKPEKKFSGFRSDLVSCVKAVAFLSLKTTELQGLCVDIRGDRCGTGDVQVTRIAIRLIDVDISVQSTLSVFCFAGKSFLFYVLCILFTLEKNLSGFLVSASLICYIVSIWLTLFAL